jgi:hypothetical protein
MKRPAQVNEPFPKKEPSTKIPWVWYLDPLALVVLYVNVVAEPELTANGCLDHREKKILFSKKNSVFRKNSENF